MSTVTATTHAQTIRAHAPVGRIRLARHEDGRPVALDTWRLTTNSMSVALAVHDLLSGSAPARWPSSAKDDLEVLTRASDLHILLDAPAIQQRYIRRDQPGWTSNGQTLTLPGGRCIADPHSRLTLAERRGLAREDGTECVTTAHFRLSAAPDLGTFIFRSSSWGLASRWRAAGLLDALSDDAYDVPAVLSLHQAPTTPSAGRHPLSFATARLVIGS